ncbi:molybdenum cofactor biosynthesis protein MoaE [Sphingomonas sp. 3-13AW]|jgi:molybdopterin synthase catalytic subunit|uniref:molybdenum cofactor biosynthesis protein MoaE n=1 Tax=Sphingomonas sp. 3-13AW TaxID=3050450 RepID=UPI003BB5B394
MIRAIIQAEPIDLAATLAAVESGGAGAVATFSGFVREDDGVRELSLEHYPGMTDAVLQTLAEEAVARWQLQAVTVIHRIGPMSPGERIVLVVTAAPHRHAALEACTFLIDRLKTDAPFWKRERRTEGARWVDARHGDTGAADRWR